MPTQTLDDLISQELGVRTRPRFDTPDVSLSTADTIVLRLDNGRVGYIIVNTGSTQALMRYRTTPTTTVHMPLAPNGGTMVSLWKNDLHLVGLELHGLVAAGTTTLHVVEILIEPSGEGE